MLRFILLAVSCFSLFANASQIDRLLKEYSQIETVTCHIRRTVEAQAGAVTFISRVYWQDNDCLHVENITPIPRRIISDGTTFFSYADGDPKGFSRPIEKLSDQMLISLRKIPGTAMDHLLRLQNTPEQQLSDKRFAYNTAENHVVITLDDLNRLVKIDFFSTADRSEKNATYEYSSFSEVLPGIWIPFDQNASLYTAPHSTVTESVKIDRYIVNKPIARSLFVPSSFFDNTVDFTDSFSEIYSQ